MDHHCIDHSGVIAKIDGLKEDISSIRTDLVELKKETKGMRKTINVWMGGLAVIVFLLSVLPKLIASAQAAVGG